MNPAQQALPDEGDLHRMSFTGIFAAPTPGLAPTAVAGALEGLLGVAPNAGTLAGEGKAPAGGFAALLVAAMVDAGQAAPAEAAQSPLGTILNTASTTVLAAAAAPRTQPGAIVQEAPKTLRVANEDGEKTLAPETLAPNLANARPTAVPAASRSARMASSPPPSTTAKSGAWPRSRLQPSRTRTACARSAATLTVRQSRQARSASRLRAKAGRGGAGRAISRGQHWKPPLWTLALNSPV